MSPLLLLLLFWAAPDAGAADASPPALSAAEVVDRMQAVYDKTRDFKASFRQVLTSTLYKRKQVSSGVVQLKKPGKMRWDYLTPEKKVFVSDGKTFWVYDAEDKQAFRQSMGDSQLPTAISFLLGTGRLDREFDASRVEDPAPYGVPGDHVIKLLPKQPSTRYKELVFDVDAETFQVKQTFVRDLQGNLNQVTFLKPELNTKIPDSVFAWTPPAGTKVVRPGL